MGMSEQEETLVNEASELLAGPIKTFWQGNVYTLIRAGHIKLGPKYDVFCMVYLFLE